MKKHLIRIVPLLVLLLAVSSLVALPTRAAVQFSIQDETMDFIENVLLVDFSTYSIEMVNNYTLANDDLPSGVDREITYIDYALNSESSNLTITFSIEKDTIVACYISPSPAQIITSKQHISQLDAVKAFLERYQTYTKLDSNNLIAMLDNVDITKDSTTTTENIKLVITNTFFGVDQTTFAWSQIINGAEYSSLSLTFDKDGNFMMMNDARTVFIIVDSSINVSEEQAIDIALENLQFYSYKMPDGSVVKDFKVSRDGSIATMVTFTGDYELRPYWKVEMFLDETAPGNVFGITAFIWANTGEIISYSNMAAGGTSSSEDSTTETVPSSVNATSGESGLVSDLLAPLGIAATIIAVIAISAVAVKKRKQ
ncbi:MAG: hypothetical protein ACFCUE_00780 [Candidatus Bathyarchaeia archaeon]|jgi:hypothetical protein